MSRSTQSAETKKCWDERRLKILHSNSTKFRKLDFASFKIVIESKIVTDFESENKAMIKQKVQQPAWLKDALIRRFVTPSPEMQIKFAF